jgi:hypothetical protein
MEVETGARRDEAMRRKGFIEGSERGNGTVMMMKEDGGQSCAMPTGGVSAPCARWFCLAVAGKR